MRESVLFSACWSLVTIASFFLAKRLHRRFGAWWSSPLILAPFFMLGITAWRGVGYSAYIGATGWLVALLGPAVVAFASPLYRKRGLILRHWPVLIAGVAVGSATSFATSWFLAGWLGLDGTTRLSMLPRSMSTPFAMVVSGDIGGAPSLTAIIVLVTGVVGAFMGEALLGVLPLRTSLAKGALFGMGAHGVGTTKALQIDAEVGSVAAVVMVLVGLTNVMAVPLLLRWVLPPR